MDPREGSATEQDDAERRKHSRFSLAIPAYLHMVGEPALLAVRTTNISRGGFVCLTSAALEVGGVMRVQVQLTPHDALDCRAQVVRVDELDSSGRRAQLLVAFRFVDLCDGGERQILEALEALGEDTDPAAGPKAVRTDKASAGR